MGSVSRNYWSLLLLGALGVGAYAILRRRAYSAAVARSESFVSKMSGWLSDPSQIGTVIEGLNPLFNLDYGCVGVVSPSVYWGYPQQSPLPKQDDQGVLPVEDLRGTSPVQPSLMALNIIWAVPATVVGAVGWFFSRRGRVPVRPPASVSVAVLGSACLAGLNAGDGGDSFLGSWDGSSDSADLSYLGSSGLDSSGDLSFLDPRGP